MAQPRSDPEFYVGYLPQAPAGIARHVRLVVLALLVLTAGAGALVATSQRAWQPGVFELGAERELRGVLVAEPVAQLRVPRPGADAGWSRWLLVRPGKHGGDPEWSALAGREVELRGALVHRPEGTLVEVVPGSLRARQAPGPPPPPAAVEPLGRVTLRGEIVDSKCWMGVMNPGNLRTHRACATLCIRGGIPPILVARDADGRTRKLLLVGVQGEALNAAVLPLVARPVEVEGELQRHDDLLVLRADPGAIRALDE